MKYKRVQCSVCGAAAAHGSTVIYSERQSKETWQTWKENIETVTRGSLLRPQLKFTFLGNTLPWTWSEMAPDWQCQKMLGRTLPYSETIAFSYSAQSTVYLCAYIIYNTAYTITILSNLNTKGEKRGPMSQKRLTSTDTIKYNQIRL